MKPRLSTIEDAFEALRSGLPVLVTDDEDRENEGDVIMAAATATTAWMAWTIRHSSGYICAPMSESRADRLGLPLMVADNRDPRLTAYTVTVTRPRVSPPESAQPIAPTRSAPLRRRVRFPRTLTGRTRGPAARQERRVLVRGGHTEAAWTCAAGRFGASGRDRRARQ